MVASSKHSARHTDKSMIANQTSDAVGSLSRTNIVSRVNGRLIENFANWAGARLPKVQVEPGRSKFRVL